MDKPNPSAWRWQVMDDVMISFGVSGPMPNDEWAKCIHDLHTKPVRKWLVTVVGTMEVSSTQRKLGIDAIVQNGMRVALVTEDRIVRGLLTAASWFGVEGKPFSWSEIDAALTYLGVIAPLRERCLDAVRQYQRESA